MKLFLRWALIETLAVALFAVLGVAFVGRVSGAPLLVAAFTVAVAAAVSAYAGVLCWRAKDAPVYDIEFRDRLAHDADHVYFAVEACQLLGLVGAAVGFYLISTSTAGSGSAADAVHHIIDGLGAGLVATLTGVMCSMVLALQRHLLVHTLER